MWVPYVHIFQRNYMALAHTTIANIISHSINLPGCLLFLAWTLLALYFYFFPFTFFYRVGQRLRSILSLSLLLNWWMQTNNNLSFKKEKKEKRKSVLSSTVEAWKWFSWDLHICWKGCQWCGWETGSLFYELDIHFLINWLRCLIHKNYT